ncbi:hypothetical protein O9K63_09725 [Janibacter cremeus]|uniref:hypothetical protein n=1 Tax=Janibacter cremeus TaxID=1285192 RepID=UPI0023F9477A|nr:hypothetical protein [Janibacter cremeus]WEV76877.1 hypothetical protein O9K63_09725 [Janibacter cremeus]
MNDFDHEDQAESTPLPLLQFSGIVHLLQDCIVRDNYRVPHSLVAPIALSQAGNDLLDVFLSRNRKFRPNEAKLAIALEFGGGDKVFVAHDTDVTSLRTAIGAEILSGRIQFPYIFGRTLHDKVVEEFPGKAHLNLKETLTALKGQYFGVFQYSDTVVGPFGCFQSRQARSLSSPPRFPGYLCPDERCRKVHWTRLSSSNSSQIVRARAEVARLITSRGTNHSMSPAKFREDLAVHLGRFDPEDASGLIDLATDSLSNSELQHVVSNCIRFHLSEQGGRSTLQRTFSIVVGDPDLTTQGLDEAQLVSLLLYFRDREIIRAIDFSVENGDIELASGEIREARVQRFPTQPGATAQIGELGFRMATSGTRPSSAPHRLANMFRCVAETVGVDISEIAYGLELPEDATVEDVASFAYTKAEDPKVIDRGLLSTRASASASSDHLGLTQQPASREEMQRRIRWRLGFSQENSPNRAIGKSRLTLRQLDDLVSGDGDEDAIRGAIANCFVAMEELLLTSLKFSTWALTVDHYLETPPFGYLPHAESFNLDEFLDVTGKNGSAPIWSRQGKPTLSELGTAYGRLSKKLRNLKAEDHRRPTSQFPGNATHAGRPFYFPHFRPFLNLDQKGRDKVSEALHTAARIASLPEVLGVRNSGLHGNNPFPEYGQLAQCIEALTELLRTLDESGLSPKAFARRGSSSDSMGRKNLDFDGKSTTTVVPVGTWTSAAKLPSDRQQLVILPWATMGEVGPLRFAILPHRGSESFWEGWPTKIESTEAFEGHISNMEDESDLAS